MRRAARIPRADDLPPLPAGSVQVGEAAPDPPPGPNRDRAALLADARLRGWEQQMTTVLEDYLDRVGGVLGARMQSPRTRKGTRWWRTSTNDPNTGGTAVEVKARPVDAGYVLTDQLVDEIGDVVGPVALRVVSESVADTAAKLGHADVGLAAFDQDAVDAAVESAVQSMLGVARRHAEEIRRAILDADATAADLDELLRRVEAAHRRGGNWLLLYGRTLTVALAADAALAAARALGVTHVQWLSRRDARVRVTHRAADGQVRRIGDRFHVGHHLLRFPADPSGLPATWPEVAGCRCSLIFTKPDPARRKLAGLAHVDPTTRPGRPAARVMSAADAADPAAGSVVTPEGLGLPTLAPLITVPEPTAAYRQLDTPLPVVPGQQVRWPAVITAALAPPAVITAATMVVVLPAGARVAAASGQLVFPAGAVFTVLEATDQGLVVTPA